jgi:four helix bundle protein
MTHYFNHEKLIVYQRAIHFVSWSTDVLENCGGKAAAKDQLRPSANSILINIAEGNSKASQNARIHCFDVSYGSSLECAACLAH